MIRVKNKLFIFSLLGALILICNTGPLSAHAKNKFKKNSEIKKAFALFKEGKQEEAVSVLKAIIDKGQKPEVISAHIHLGVMYLSMERYDDAINTFLTTLQLDGKKFMAYYHLGLLYEAKASQSGTADGKTGFKKKALESWKTFINNSEQKADKDSGVHKHACDSKYIDTANKHIKFLKEELGDE